MNNNIKWAIAVIGVVIFGFSLFNASWIADEPKGEIKLLGHGNWTLPTDVNDCIIDPELAVSDIYYNADIRSLRTVAAYNADAVKFDTELQNNQILVPRPPKTDCPADNIRPRSTIVDAINAMSGLDILIPIKSGEKDKADAIIAALKDKEFPNRIWVYGDNDLVRKIAKETPRIKALPIQKARQCTTDYMKSGWYGHIPESCAQGNAIILINDYWTLWGWPNRLMARFADNDIHIFIAKDIAGGDILGLTDVTSYGDIPESFVGTIWIEDIKNLGPALRR